jgi:hypothetical protein
MRVTGVGGGFHGHGRLKNGFGVELHFENKKKESNKNVVEKFEKLCSVLEQRTGERVIIQKDWGKYWSRIYIENNDGSMSEELKRWAVEKMKIFYDTLQPELDKIKK